MNLNTLQTIKWYLLSLLTTFLVVQNLSAQCSNICSIPFDENDIIYPFDITTSEASVNTLKPEYLNPPYNKPTLNIDNCDKIDYQYKDTFESTEGPSCFKILRKWTVIDWCQFKPNAPLQNGNTIGKWTHTQTITVIDFTPPVFTDCPNDLIFENTSISSENTFVELIKNAQDISQDLKYSYEIDLFNNGNIDLSGKSNNASGNYPKGKHKVSFTAEDRCGNRNHCSFFIQIKENDRTTASLSKKSQLTRRK